MLRIVTGWVQGERKRFALSQRKIILDFGGDKSFADDLNIEQSAVSSRVALLLRSAEAKLLFSRFVFPWEGSMTARLNDLLAIEYDERRVRPVHVFFSIL